jgi:hypothetical protein
VRRFIGSANRRRICSLSARSDSFFRAARAAFRLFGFVFFTSVSSKIEHSYVQLEGSWKSFGNGISDAGVGL